MDSKAFRQVYSDIRKINKGGIGTIYHAYQKNLGKEVVLKRIDSSQNLSMLRREVDILKNLRHSYLPTVYDFVEVKGVYYIVEDYINGTSLDWTVLLQSSSLTVTLWVLSLTETVSDLQDTILQQTTR